MTSIHAIAFLVALVPLAGCATPSEAPDDTTTQSDQTEPSPSPWDITAQRDLGIYAGVQVLSSRYWLPEPGYCRSLTFEVPKGSDRLEFELVTSDDSTGVLGFNAKSEDGEQWRTYPNVYDPSESFLDNPKRVAFNGPASGKWTVTLLTQGPAYQAIGNLTIRLAGASAEPPTDLDIQMLDPNGDPCKP